MLSADIRTTRYDSLPAPRAPRYHSLDAWRGLACLMIVVVHSLFYVQAREATGHGAAEAVGRAIVTLFSKFGIGVPLFFVISGYCISATADSTRRTPGRVWQYFKRRLRRIFPPYWVAVLATMAVIILVAVAGWPHLFSDANNPLPHPGEFTPAQWLGNLTLTEQWRWHIFGDGKRLQLGPAWSLCYEEQFYAVCGLLLLAAPRRFFAGVWVVSLGTLAVAPLIFTPSWQAVDGFFFDGRWLMFAAGVLVYYYLNYATPAQGRLLLLLLGAGLLAAVALRYGLLGAGNRLHRERSFEFVAALAFALVLIGLRPWDQRLAQSRVLWPLAWCGQMCYSLYLVHRPVTKVITHALDLAGVNGVGPTLLFAIPATVAASLALAWVFHRVVERRFLNAPAAGTSRVARAEPAGGGLGTPVGRRLEGVPLVPAASHC